MRKEGRSRLRIVGAELAGRAGNAIVKQQHSFERFCPNMKHFAVCRREFFQCSNSSIEIPHIRGNSLILHRGWRHALHFSSRRDCNMIRRQMKERRSWRLFIAAREMACYYAAAASLFAVDTKTRARTRYTTTSGATGPELLLNCLVIVFVSQLRTPLTS